MVKPVFKEPLVILFFFKKGLTHFTAYLREKMFIERTVKFFSSFIVRNRGLYLGEKWKLCPGVTLYLCFFFFLAPLRFSPQGYFEA